MDTRTWPAKRFPHTFRGRVGSITVAEPAAAQWTLKLLDRIEQEEIRLLAWGLVDGSFSRPDLEEFIERHRAGLGMPSDIDSDLALAELERLKLLVRLEYPNGLVYRSRMAETTRLLARLKQLFPKHLKGRGWQVAPNLVSDFRIALRPRLFPRREISPDTAIDVIGKKVRLDSVAKRSIESLLEGSPPTQLARFQLDAAVQILVSLAASDSSGTIVSAGTGSGKTLAFYLPALTYIAGIASSSPWTKALAIYPRNELLKDQLTETLRAVRKLNTSLRELGKGSIRVGAYYGDTPRSNTSVFDSGGQGRVGQAWTCGFLRCPECDGPLVWSAADRSLSVETLRCSRATCGSIVTSDEFVLTRKSIQEAPPDIVFSTTEMLNRHLDDSWSRHIFGVGPRARRKPRLMLLDEVHTYEGTTGAQVAYLLRRWRRAVGGPIEFVGLSATLREARAFFSQLTGLPEHLVTAAEPSFGDLEQGGAEYLLALRGDPVSGASLLSTTIQTSMLLRRSLDPSGRPISEGAYGSRLFLFTDDLDVTNRLYNDTLDAEAMTRFGTPKTEPPLAALRSPALQDRLPRLLAGQSWDMCEELGFGLGTFRARVGRTSSQDTGVDLTSDVIVATASLEVGFNDPAVGAIIQHKAPRGTAQFLQRKGRAGRTRPMRPWTVVVLSDYGRDRLAYQGYDLLFDPELEPRSLPLGNRYVMKMQAAYAVLDWFAEEMGDVPRGSVWTDLAGPDANPNRSPYTKKRQARILKLTEDLLQEPEVLARLRRFLAEALKVGSDEIESLLWDPPRAIVTALLPTIRRRLATEWRSAISTRPTDYVLQGQPIPDFVPTNLFSDLSLPEVEITVPSPNPSVPPEAYSMPILQALREFAPGRVSYRFGIGSSLARHWVAPDDLSATTQVLDLAAFVTSHDELGTFDHYGQDGTSVGIRCLRPWKIETSIPTNSVADSSNSFLDWRTEILPYSEGATVDLPKLAGWEHVIEGMCFHLHSLHSGVELRRFAIGARASLAFQDGRRVDTTLDFMASDQVSGEQQNAAVGYAIDVDALVLTLGGPMIRPDLAGMLSAEQMRSLRSAYFQHRVVQSVDLANSTNGFERGWLHQLYASAITAEAMRSRVSLLEAHRSLTGPLLAAHLHEVLDVIFQALPTDEQHGGDGQLGPPPSSASGRIYDRLLDLCASADIQAGLSAAAPALWEAPTSDLWEWADRRLRATLAAAVVEAIQRLCPDVDATKGIVVDLERGPSFSGPVGSNEIWLCETVPGGGGVLQRVFARYAEDPRRFFRLIESALRPSDFELVDAELRRVLKWAHTDDVVANRLEAVRTAGQQSLLQEAFSGLLECLQQRGAFMCHPVVAALNARVLRPASSASTDKLLNDLVSRWDSEEERLGIEVDARVFAYLCKGDIGIDSALVTSGLTPPADAEAWRFGAVYSLLWPRGWIVRAHALSVYNPFADIPATDSRLLRELLLRPPAAVLPHADGELDPDAVSALTRDGAVALTAPATDSALLRRAILNSLASPVDVGYLHLYPRLAAVERSPNAIAVHLELGDAPQ
jgi:DEAD/DEAH box helicase/Helicase conserved C-terminal domain